MSKLSKNLIEGNTAKIKENTKRKQEKAITLIALVITIIVLLILADPHIFLNIPQ